MKVTMFWFGGPSYAMFDVHNPDHAEVFDSLRDAKLDFGNRPGDIYYPCVNESAPDDDGPEAWLFFGDVHPVIGSEYPDAIMRFGKRGGVVVDRHV